MKIQLNLDFNGNGKKILAYAASIAIALTVIIVGAMWWQSGAGLRESNRITQQMILDREQQRQEVLKEIQTRPKKEIPHRIIIAAKYPREEVEDFQKLPWGDRSSFIYAADKTLTALWNAAENEFKQVYGEPYAWVRDLTQEHKDLSEKLGHKYAVIFDKWFAPKWEAVKKAGPGKASWNLEFEPIDPKTLK